MESSSRVTCLVWCSQDLVSPLPGIEYSSVNTEIEQVEHIETKQCRHAHLQAVSSAQKELAGVSSIGVDTTRLCYFPSKHRAGIYHEQLRSCASVHSFASKAVPTDLW